MLKTLDGNKGVAETALNCSPDVVAAYPITPSTSIVEHMGKFYADGLLKSYIATEAEFSVISALVGASAAGARTFSATSSQGLLLMHEVLHNAAGMRLPIVLAVANRAVSAPLSIWNDSQDSISQRDTGWLQLYARSNQEATDLIPQAFKIAESTGLPAMVCFDGFFLTHCIEQIDILSKEQIDKFLPAYKPEVKLDPQNPMTFGAYATPPYYEDFRKDLDKDMNAALQVVEKTGAEFGKMFGRNYTPIETYRLEDAEFVIAGLGGMMCNARVVVEELRSKGEKVGWFNLRSFRPFPREAVKKALAGKKIAVVEKDLSLGSMPPIYTEIAESLFGTDSVISTFTGGLGGREVGRKEFRSIYERLKRAGKTPLREWI